jgi:hypothetical protein
MVDSDIVAFPVCVPVSQHEWSRGKLTERTSYWHQRERVQWAQQGTINYFRVGGFREVAHAKSSVKGVTEGTETSITWDAIFSTRNGIVETITEGRKISIRRDSDGHLYTWQNPRGLAVVVIEGAHVHNGQVLASAVPPLAPIDMECSCSLSADHLRSLLHSPERSQRFTGVKLARLRNEPAYAETIRSIAVHPDEDIYVLLESRVYLARVSDFSAANLFSPYLQSQDDQIRLEAVVALAEVATSEAVNILAQILRHSKMPYFLRSAAAWGLGKIGTDCAIDKLVQAFADVDVTMREEALDIITALGAKPIEHLVQALVGGDPDLAAGSAEAMRRLPSLPGQAVDTIIQAIREDPDHVWAVWLLGQCADNDNVASVISELQDSRPEAHYAVSVLWTFAKSWIARHWELWPEPIRCGEMLRGRQE